MTTTAWNPRLIAALAHARTGRSVLPVYWLMDGLCGCGHRECRGPAKHPVPYLVPHGVGHATTSRVVIRAWWAAAPLANPALATGEGSGITVLDVDSDKGGYDSLAQLEHEFGPLPRTQGVQTASGEHLYFRYSGTHLRNTAGKLGPGLDVRCCGGYVVAVGATHVTGHVYTWKRGSAPSETPIAPIPDWMHDRLANGNGPVAISPIVRSPRGYASAALASEEQQLLATKPGQRNARLNLAAFRLGRFIQTRELTQTLESSRKQTSRTFCWRQRLGSGSRSARRAPPSPAACAPAHTVAENRQFPGVEATTPPPQVRRANDS